MSVYDLGYADGFTGLHKNPRFLSACGVARNDAQRDYQAGYNAGQHDRYAEILLAQRETEAQEYARRQASQDPDRYAADRDISQHAAAIFQAYRIII